MKPLFDPLAFGDKVRAKLYKSGLSLREAETVTGVDHSTIQRVIMGNPPTVENYLRLAIWLGDDEMQQRGAG